MGELDNVEAPDPACVLGPEFLAGAAVGLQLAQREHLRAACTLDRIERLKPPQHVVVIVHDGVVHPQARLRLCILALAQKIDMPLGKENLVRIES